jgi:hypothetical protein
VIYTAWGRDGQADCLVPGKEKPHFVDGTPIDDAHEVIWTIEAGSWEEAMQKYYDLQGWGGYRAIED